MYPMVYFGSFPQLAVGTEVFVAMPMSDPAFHRIWHDVYMPAIDSVGLKPFRVNIPMTGDSILIEILSGVRRARLVLADITPDEKSGSMPNANVLYELGIAHCLRLPETVIVVRQEKSQVPFDVSHLRVLDYCTDSLTGACDRIRAYLSEALKTTARCRDELVSQVWALLDPVCRDLIAMEWSVASGRVADLARENGESYDYGLRRPGEMPYRTGNVMYGRWKGEDIRPAFQRLVECGVLELKTEKWEMKGMDQPEATYRFTLLGEEVAKRFTSCT